MKKLFETLKAKMQRDAGMPWPVLVRKSLRYGWELAWAPWYLRAVNELGSGVRTLGQPRIENFGFMHIGAGTLIRSVNVPVELCTAPKGRLHIGQEVRLNYGVSIGATGTITVGDYVRIGPYVMIVDTNFHDVYNRCIRPEPAFVTIEDDVWIGAKASILPGVHIGQGSVIGTGAVVTRDVKAFSVVAGVPARCIKQLDQSRFISERTHLA